ncbi:uncharacterized protein LOC142923326 [Petromyzon marinus]|uniref:uncharacterized protein LOC142923326 n=1 Tax=Petromyzon marinus TaxID=7757 RepID=UPI003F72CEF3
MATGETKAAGEPLPDGAQWRWTPAPGGRPGAWAAAVLFVGTWSNAGVRVQGGVGVHQPALFLAARNFTLMFGDYRDEFAGSYDCHFSWHDGTDVDGASANGSGAGGGSGCREEGGKGEGLRVPLACVSAGAAALALAGVVWAVAARRGHRESLSKRTAARCSPSGQHADCVYEKKGTEPLYVQLTMSAHRGDHEYSSIRYAYKPHGDSAMSTSASPTLPGGRGQC